MSLDKRTREWIHRPVYYGAPSFVTKYFQAKLKEFREKHKDFDEFLFELDKILRKENNPDFNNLIKFIDGNAKANWVCSDKSLFSIFIDLYNLCFSPEQAFEYIKECYEIYKVMLNSDYKLDNNIEISIQTDRWDGKAKKFISFNVVPIEKSSDLDSQYWFGVETSLTIVEDNINPLDTSEVNIELRCSNEKFSDALRLFENYQDRGLLRKVFKTGINELVSKGIIKEVNQSEFYESVIHEYETDLTVGRIK